MRFHTFFLPARHKRAAYGLYGVAAALLAGSLTLATVQPAHAGDGTDWGPDGAMAASSSAVTVNWDNSGSTPSADQVPRDGSQVLPHTGGKTYNDVSSDLNTAAKTDFGGAQLSVSQTTGLTHEAVSLSLSGVNNQEPVGNPETGFTVMQCWGSTTETQPDPQDCQSGVGMVDSPNTIYTQGALNIAPSDADLISGGDLKADTHVVLAGTQSGTKVTLNAFVTTDVGNHPSALATGAAGKVVFATSDGTALATAQVDGGSARAVVTAPASGDVTYTAQYEATSTENFEDSDLDTEHGADDSVVLPSSPKSVPTNTATWGDAGTNSSPNQTVLMPQRSVDGTFQPVTPFTKTTTNELGDLTDGSHPFEVQTGAESSFLGCGYTGQTSTTTGAQESTSTCWLVLVPAWDSTFPGDDQNPPASPLTPSLWAQRMQVKLSFANVAQSCGSGARQLSVGSELLLDAMNSWIPAICASEGVDFGYTPNDDTSARNAYSQGSTSIAFTSEPIDDSGGGTSTLYAPAGLADVTISVLATKVLSNTVTGFEPVTGIKLNARLVAKLLTESYVDGIDGFTQTEAPKDLPWETTLPQRLSTDPEFLALNPDLPRSLLDASDLIVTVGGSDATTALWDWIVEDPDAKAFLDGCPDTASVVNGKPMTINPFYSTRSYTECADQKDALASTANAERAPQSASNPDGTALPATYTDSTPSYPPTGGTFPQPGYYERAAVKDNNGNVSQLADSLANLHPRENTFSAIATDVFDGQEKTLDSWCTSDLSCPGNVVVAPGAFVNGATAEEGSGVMGLTDGTSAAKDLLPTAMLCATADSTGQDCVGADNDSVTKAAAKFTASGTGSHFESLNAASFSQNDWYADGAYPLTVPVYAEINTNGLDQQSAQDYAKVLQYITTTGQQQGIDIGDLPPGMAPLTDGLVSQDQAAIVTLKAIKDPPPANTSSNVPPASSGGNPPPSDQSGEVPPVSVVPVSSPAPSGTTANPAPTSSPQALPGATAWTPALAGGVYPWAVGGGLAGALASGVAAPLVGRKRKVGPL